MPLEPVVRVRTVLSPVPMLTVDPGSSSLPLLLSFVSSRSVAGLKVGDRQRGVGARGDDDVLVGGDLAERAAFCQVSVFRLGSSRLVARGEANVPGRPGEVVVFALMRCSSRA